MNTLRMLAEYRQGLLKAKDGQERIKIIDRINQLQKDISDHDN